MAGLRADLVPATATGDDLAAAFPAAPEGGGTVLVPRAEVVRGALAEGLRVKGWTVDDVVAYRTVGGDPDPAAVVAARGADAVAFTSSSTVDRTIGLLGAPGVPAVVVTIGPVTSDTVRAAGLHVTLEASESTIDGLVAALVSALPAHPWRQQQQ
jgi:uroporphyrinogen-III synthase